MDTSQWNFRMPQNMFNNPDAIKDNMMKLEYLKPLFMQSMAQDTQFRTIEQGIHDIVGKINMQNGNPLFPNANFGGLPNLG